MLWLLLTLLTHVLPLTVSANVWWTPGKPIPSSKYSRTTIQLVPNQFDQALSNTNTLLHTINNATPGTTLFVPAAPNNNPYWVTGGIHLDSLQNITIVIEGEFRAVTNCYDGCWPTMDNHNHGFMHIFLFTNSEHLVINGNGMGRIDGSGKGWWNRYVFGNHTSKKRPKMFVFQNVTDLKISNMTFINSPSFNLLLNPVLRVEISHVTVVTDRNVVRRLKTTLSQRRRRLSGATAAGLQPEDLNTDGIDPSGKDIWIHDCSIQNDDDSIAVKPLSNVIIGSDNTHLTCCENILIENTMLTGFGASIGSVPPHADHNCVRNVTFRNISMPGTGKGVYIKSNPTCGDNKTAEITDILYEDIDIHKPLWWPIWIGPQQQQEPGSALGRKCALQYPFFNSQCPTQGCVDFRNITLRRVTVTDPLFSPGVVLGNATNVMEGIVFEDVVVVHPGIVPYDKKYLCKHAVGVAKGTTSPVPSCFTKE